MADGEDRGEEARIYDRSTTLVTRRSASTAAPLAMLGLLGVQFLLGMAVNLYVQLPSAGAGMAQMMRSGPFVMVHMMLGMILAAGALVAVAVALPYGRWAVGCAAVALGGILVAGLGGLLFLMDGQSNGASYLMAVGFLVAVGGYVVALVCGRDHSVQSVSPAYPPPEGILAERFARGEVDDDEYRERVEALRGHTPRAGEGGAGG